MNIHRYEKLWILASMVLIIFFIGSITYGAVGAGVTMIDDREDTIDPDALNEHEDFGDPGVHEVGENEYEVYVQAYHPSFIPNTIVVPENSTVTFKVTSGDVIHSFSIVGTNANTMVIPGEISSMTVEFDETGEYGIVCNEYCGEFHHLMEGEVIVVPEDDFELEDDS